MTPWRPMILDLDSSVIAQAGLSIPMANRLDCTWAKDSARLWTNRKAARRLRETLLTARQPNDAPWLTFIGSGDYHHMTAFLLETLPRQERPIHLVLIDNHPDWFTLPPRYHCGNWIGGLLRHPWVASVTFIGQDSGDLDRINVWTSPTRDWLQGRLTIYPYAKPRMTLIGAWPRKAPKGVEFERSWIGTTAILPTVESKGLAAILDEVVSRVGDDSVYLSIDKDCLRTADATTDWEQGRMTVNELQCIISTLKTRCHLIGADICGERAPTPLQGVLKRLDAGARETRVTDWTTVNALNAATNRVLLRTVMGAPDAADLPTVNKSQVVTG